MHAIAFTALVLHAKACILLITNSGHHEDGLTDLARDEWRKTMTHTAMELAVEAKSGGGTTLDDVACLVSVYRPELANPYGNDEETDAKFSALVDEVMALIPTAKFSQKSAEEWAHAGAVNRACDRAEQFTPFGFA